jgi:hypothetical protein
MAFRSTGGSFVDAMPGELSDWVPPPVREIGILEGNVTSFDLLLYEIGLRSGRLSGAERAVPDAVARALIAAISEVDEMIYRLTDADCFSSHLPGSARLQVFLDTRIDRNNSLCTTLDLETSGKSDFRYDPRPKRIGDHRPGNEAVHLRNITRILDPIDPQDELLALLAELTVSAHRRIHTNLSRHFEVTVRSEPTFKRLPNGGIEFGVSDSQALVQRRASEHGLNELSASRSLLAAFQATFPNADPARFAETYRTGKRKGWTSARIGAELAVIGAPANSDGNVSGGFRSGSRRFEYTVKDLSGAVKMIEAALLVVGPIAVDTIEDHPSPSPRS